MVHLDDLLASTGGQLAGPAFGTDFEDFCYDSRLLNPGELFIALRTDKADGHDYVEQVCAKGAAGVLVERPFDLRRYGATCIVVPDTHKALHHWARHILRQYGTRVIAVAGSSGKTTTKEAIATILSRRFRVFRNYENYNDRLGLPIAIGRLQPEDEIAVLEMAADSFGEIAKLCWVAPPQMAVVTNINHTHFGYLGSLEAIAEENAQVIAALPADGLAILNGDDEHVVAMGRNAPCRSLRYGTSAAVDVRGTEPVFSLEGTGFTLCSEHGTCRITTALLGWPGLYAALAAAATGLAHGVPLDEIAEVLQEFPRLKGRLQVLPGCHGGEIIDDTFNASPASALAALDVLSLAKGGKKVVILGDMTNLGRYEEEGHQWVGRELVGVADVLITKGSKAGIAAAEARRAGFPLSHIYETDVTEEAAGRAREVLEPGDTVLAKGSEEARMERVVEALMAEPGRARDLLVRQNEAWRQIVVLHPDRPTWVEVDVGAIAHNVRRLKEIVGPRVEIMAILKADGYGHGALRVARTALANGAAMVGVACLSEAITLRRAGITAPVLVLGYTPPVQARELVLHGVAATVFSADTARSLSRAATALRARAAVHLKIDTGMGRLGVKPELAAALAAEIAGMPGVEIEGVFTHFAQADAEDKTSAQAQLTAFRRALTAIGEAGIVPRYIHAANSAAVLSLPESHFNLVRPGIAVYGLDPSSAVRCPPDFRPALSFKTQVAQVKELPAGSAISYGGTFRTSRPSRIAVLPVGYGDGFRRSP
jgi:alanine racemase